VSASNPRATIRHQVLIDRANDVAWQQEGAHVFDTTGRRTFVLVGTRINVESNLGPDFKGAERR
jgi:hypothetical protein